MANYPSKINHFASYENVYFCNEDDYLNNRVAIESDIIVTYRPIFGERKFKVVKNNFGKTFPILNHKELVYYLSRLEPKLDKSLEKRVFSKPEDFLHFTDLVYQ